MAKKKYEYKTATIKLPNGKRKYIRAKTQKELEEKLDAAKRELHLGINIAADITFKEYAEQWLELTKRPYVAGNTFNRIARQLRLHVFPTIGNVGIRDIKASHIHLIKRKIAHLGHGSQSQVFSHLRCIFNLAVDDNLILRSPVPITLKPGGDTTEEAVPLTPDQEKKLLRAAEGLAIYPFVYLVLHTGLRRGEATGLLWRDIDYEKEVIHVQRHVVSDADTGRASLVDGAKTRAGVREVPMPKQLMVYLRKRQREARSVYVLPNSKGQLYSAAALSRAWDLLQDKLDFKVNPHQLRHTYVTKLFEAGLDIKQIQYVVGHSSEQTTLKLYTHYRKDARHSTTIAQIQAAF